jgi:hypothetical protein
MSNSSVASFQTAHYQNHNQKRLAHLASLGLDITGKTVLELGAGIGDHTGFWLDRGCQVVSIEARVEVLAVLQARYPQVTALALDLEDPQTKFEGSFDIVYCYGLLYHLANPETALVFMAEHCRNLLLLETCVSFGSEMSPNICVEDDEEPTQSFSGQGCRPTRPWLHHQLKQHFEFVYMPATQPNHLEFPLDWTVSEPPQPLIRSVFIASRSPIDNPLLRLDIPMHQVCL